MVNKEEYEKGLRCKGICFKCSDNLICYQGIQSNKERESSTIDKLKEELKSKDIRIQWLEKMVNYYKKFEPVDSESFKKEYDCKWVGGNKND